MKTKKKAKSPTAKRKTRAKKSTKSTRPTCASNANHLNVMESWLDTSNARLKDIEGTMLQHSNSIDDVENSLDKAEGTLTQHNNYIKPLYADLQIRQTSRSKENLEKLLNQLDDRSHKQASRLHELEYDNKGLKDYRADARHDGFLLVKEVETLKERIAELECRRDHSPFRQWLSKAWHRWMGIGARA